MPRPHARPLHSGWPCGIQLGFSAHCNARQGYARRPLRDMGRAAGYASERRGPPMTESTTRRLIEAMLNSRKVNPDTRSELEEYLGDIVRGELHPDDARYVAALARRLGFDDAGTAAEAGGVPDADHMGGAPGRGPHRPIREERRRGR